MASFAVMRMASYSKVRTSRGVVLSEAGALFVRKSCRLVPDAYYSLYMSCRETCHRIRRRSSQAST